MRRIGVWWGCFVAGLLLSGGMAVAADCQKADDLFASSRGGDQSPQVLEQVIALCPTHAMALNNLALQKERQGDLAAAEDLYRRAIANGGGAVPYAGLGDVQLAQGDKTGAQMSYSRFLDLLAQEVAAGDPNGLASHEAAYREKLNALGGAAPQMVKAELVARGLTQKPLRTRGLTVVHHAEPHIDIPILFALGSARLTSEAKAQLTEIARALQSSDLAGSRILVEGHTDSTGDSDYNLALSAQRADAVRQSLIALGVAESRLTPDGKGETQPVADNTTEQGRRQNRRVTFVNRGQGN